LYWVIVEEPPSIITFLSDDGGGFLHYNPIQGALNGKEEKEGCT
jgi:hypothetical protein